MISADVVRVTVGGPPLWQSLLIGFGGAVVGAFGSYLAARSAAARQLRFARTERREEAYLDLLSVLMPLRAMVRITLTRHHPPTDGPLFQTRSWVGTRNLLRDPESHVEHTAACEGREPKSGRSSA